MREETKDRHRKAKQGWEVGDICLLRLVWLHRALQGLSYITTFIISATVLGREVHYNIDHFTLLTLCCAILGLAEKAYR